VAGASVEIANEALAFLGEQALVSDADDAPAADVIRGQWGLVRRAELSAHPWLFATTRAAIAASAEAPPFGWARAFPLPADCLRLLEPVDSGAGTFPWGDWALPYGAMPESGMTAFEIEEGRILSDLPAPLRIRYVRDVEDWTRWHPLFARAVAMQLAVLLAELVTQSTTRREEAMKAYQDAIARARRVNAIQRPPRFLRPVSAWLRAGR
jgi:hypothetical protein